MAGRSPRRAPAPLLPSTASATHGFFFRARCALAPSRLNAYGILLITDDTPLNVYQRALRVRLSQWMNVLYRPRPPLLPSSRSASSCHSCGVPSLNFTSAATESGPSS